MQKDFTALVQQNRKLQQQSIQSKNKETINLRIQQVQKKEQQQKNDKISILVISEVHKDRIDNYESVQCTNRAIRKLSKFYQGITFYSHHPQQFPRTISFCDANPTPKIDYILTVGTNDTLLYTFLKFEKETTPPILGFSSQGESTLFNFTKCDMDIILQNFVKKLKSNRIKQSLEQYPKLQVVLDNQVFKNFTCQIQIGRGRNPALVKMDLYYKNLNQQEEIYIGKLWGDGLVISTAYGSVARSMVLNGPIIHKKIQSLILTPVCPLSLKFRPIVLPINCNIIIKIDQNSRAGGSLYIDGKRTQKDSTKIIQPGQKIIIRKSDTKTIMINNLNGSYEKELFLNLQQFLSWGEQFSSKNYKT